MVDYMNLTPGEEQVRQDGFSELNALQEQYDALDAELVDAIDRAEEAEAEIEAMGWWYRVWKWFHSSEVCDG